ncbi:MAG: hypothetical protein ABSH01_03185 [Terriglobia bacterium]|jgi:hypothetical protein
MRVEFYRSLSRLVARVVRAGAMHVTTDAQTPGQNINTVSGGKRPGGNPFLQRQSEVKAELRTT